MHGPSILAAYLSHPGKSDKNGHKWQYNSRSDRHSKVACWGVAFDLMLTSSVMREQARDGDLVLGINHEMRDYESDRKKDLDLVLARPVDDSRGRRSFKSLAKEWEIPLNEEQREDLAKLPDVPEAGLSEVLIAVEAKACMTAHVKALPRLHDELNSSHHAIHGASSGAIAIGYVQLNVADIFYSSVENKDVSPGLPLRKSQHRMPGDAVRVLDKVRQIKRRTKMNDSGFDAIGVTVLELKNDGSPVRVVQDYPAPQPGDNFYYSTMIQRMATEFASRFREV